MTEGSKRGRPVRSPLDEARFGVSVARVDNLGAADVDAAIAFCREERVSLLIARCATADLPAAQALEQAGAILTDTLVYFTRDVSEKGPAIPEDSGTIPVRPVTPSDAEAVRLVAAEAFRGYTGHYHADPRLDSALADEAYRSWAVRSCTSRDVADEVLVAELAGAVVGFATLRLNSADEGEGVLFGVAPAAQGRGLYRTFMIRAMQWVAGRGARRMIVSTQVTNVAVQKVWVRVGFEPGYSFYTFHLWLEQ